MKIAEFSVRNVQFTIVAFVALLAGGIWALVTIPRAEDPTFPIPTFPIIAVYPGASPADPSMERPPCSGSVTGSRYLS